MSAINDDHLWDDVAGLFGVGIPAETPAHAEESLPPIPPPLDFEELLVQTSPHEAPVLPEPVQEQPWYVFNGFSIPVEEAEPDFDYEQETYITTPLTTPGEMTFPEPKPYGQYARITHPPVVLTAQQQAAGRSLATGTTGLVLGLLSILPAGGSYFTISSALLPIVMFFLSAPLAVAGMIFSMFGWFGQAKSIRTRAGLGMLAAGAGLLAVCMFALLYVFSQKQTGGIYETLVFI